MDARKEMETSSAHAEVMWLQSAWPSRSTLPDGPRCAPVVEERRCGRRLTLAFNHLIAPLDW
jgi:hypothetical protein